MILQRHVTLAGLDVPDFDGFVVRAADDLLIVRFQAPNGGRVALFSYPVQRIYAQTVIDAPEFYVEI